MGKIARHLAKFLTLSPMQRELQLGNPGSMLRLVAENAMERRLKLRFFQIAANRHGI